LGVVEVNSIQSEKGGEAVSSQDSFWKKYISNVQLDMSIAALTHVPVTWKETNYIPDFNKLYFILDGEGFVKIGNQEYYPQPGQMYLLPAGTIQSYGTISSKTFSKYWCHFTATVNNFPLFQIIETSPFVPVSDPELLKDKFDQLMYWQHKEEITSGIRVNSILLEIIALFMEQSEAVHLNTGTTMALKKINIVLNYIQTHLSEPLSVEELAQLIHFHPNYFIRLFKNTTGLSPIQYVNRTRVEKAKHLLTFSQLNISSIADNLGMDISYFSRMFKEHTGFAPSDFREMLPSNQKDLKTED
jgi:AraC family transcriptional regulator of arabinose operon